MHSQKIKLVLTKEQRKRINQIFFVAYKVYVVCVKHVQKQLRRLNRNQRYKYLLHLYSKYKEEDKTFPYKDELNSIIESYKIDKNNIEKYLIVQSHKYKHILTSTQVQRIADNVAQAVDAFLYHNGKAVHIKKFADFNTISQKRLNGLKYNGYDIYFMKERYKLKGNIKINPEEIKTLELKKIEFDNGYEYYVNFILKGPQEQRLKRGDSTSGIDPGVSTIAVATDNQCMLEELAPKCKDYNKKIAHLQKLIDISVRSTNKDKINPDGTFKKGSKLEYSKHAKYLKRKVRVLYRKKSDYTNCMHRQIINKIIQDSKIIKIESMDFNALAKRSKKLERSEDLSTVKTKTGEKEVHKYKKRKRFGKSVNDRSPGLFIKILKDKCELYNIKLIEINTQKVKASQYNHKTGECEKHKLSERTKPIGEDIVQRDLYSAFLIKNVKKDLKTIDKNKCKKDFNKFLENQEKEIARIKDAGIKNKNFGF